MSSAETLQLFEDQPIRTAWDNTEEEWYFSIVDVIGVLTEQPDSRRASTYWAVMKKRLNEEGAIELLTNCKQLRLKAVDGKPQITA
jgi:maltooligosyltrehalose synthase